MPTSPKQFKPAGAAKQYKPRDARPSAAQRGYGPRWRRVRQLALERDNYLCQVCLKRGKVTTHKGMHVDHITPLAEGGAHYDLSNLQTLCQPCHSTKTAREDGGFGNAK